MVKTKVAFLTSFFLIILLVSFLSVPLAFAQDDYYDDYEDTISEIEKERVNLAFSWLSDQVKETWPSDAEENALALLALSYDDYLSVKGEEAMLAKGKENDSCWSVTGSCELKTTAQALLALSETGLKTTRIEDWLLSRKGTFTAANLVWHLQIDADKETKCSITYDDNVYEILLHEKPNQIIEILSGPAGGCLSPSMDNYWLKIKGDENCIGKTYSIECENEVKVSLPYQKGKILFIPGETQIKDYVEAKIEVECLMDSGSTSCDYEGTAWAAYALSKERKNIGKLLPYLISQADALENKKYLPDALLYLLTERMEYADNVVNSEYYDKRGFWETSAYGRYYTTALALFALDEYYGVDSTISKVKEYLVDHQDSEGFWDDGSKIGDTAFLLHVLWPGEGDSYIPPEENLCEEEGFICRENCLDDEEESSYYNKYCAEEVCCEERKHDPSCVVVEDCLDWNCEDVYIGGCKCSYGKESLSLCDDNCDNDGDGFTDDEDPDCLIEETDCEENNYVCCGECEDDVWGAISEYDDSCSRSSVCCTKCLIVDAEDCTNKEDDDGDGRIDCDDPDCANDDACKRSYWWILILVVVIGGLVGGYFYLKKQEFDFSEFLNSIVSKISRKKEKGERFKFTPGVGVRPTVPARRIVRTRAIRPTGTGIARGQKLIRRNIPTDAEKQLGKTLKKLKKIGEK